MVGRLCLFTDAEEIKSKYNISEIEFRTWSSYNIKPTNKVLIVVDNNGHRELTKMRWGLKPHWAKDRPTGYFKSRAEGILESRMFATPFKQRRCLVPVNGYFEWQHSERRKIPYYIKLKSREIFSFAGLFESYPDEDKD